MKTNAVDPVKLQLEDPVGESAVDNLFTNYERRIHEQADWLFGWLLIGQWIAALFLALVVSPRTWVGPSSFVHIHVWTALFLGGLLALPSVILFRIFP